MSKISFNSSQSFCSLQSWGSPFERSRFNYCLRFGKLQIYPEGIDPTGRKCYIPYDGGNQQCRRKPKGILAPPYTNERINGEILIPSFPISILVQESYDTRELEQRVAEKAIDFINDNAHKEVTFISYCYINVN